MLENQSIVCFGSDPWGSIWRNRHQIMSRLARTNRVLYVEPYLYPVNKAVKTLLKGQKQGERLQNIADDLWIYRHPLWGGTSRWPILEQFGFRLRISALRRTLEKLQMSAPIVWIVNPRHGNVIGQLGESLICYHVVDNYTAAHWHSAQARAAVVAAEQFMLSVADLVVVTAPALLEDKQRYHNNVYLVKNAVNYTQFAAAVQNAQEPPADMAAISPPIIGYVGAIEDKLDYGLLSAVARARPDWSFVMVGPLPTRPTSAAWQFRHNHPPNVHLLGRREVTEVPHYIQACQVCVLPYRQDDFTKGIDSLKLYEYLACEKPIVATDIPATREYSHVVHIAKDVPGFVQKIETALIPPGSEQRALMRSIALQNTWDQRVDQISSLIQATLDP